MEIAIRVIDVRVNPGVRVVRSFNCCAFFNYIREASVVSDFVAVFIELVAHAFVDAYAV